MHKSYSQYCPVAHALDLVGERWSLLIVKELMRGPRRYTDLAEQLPGIGTNILADRLRALEAGGVLTKHRLPPPAASQVYELTDYGRELRGPIRELALWGARSLGPPAREDELFHGWLPNALDCVFAETAPPGRFEFRVDGEVAALVDGQVTAGSVEDPDVVVTGDPEGLYWLFVERRIDDVSVEGDLELLDRLIAATPRPVELAG